MVSTRNAKCDLWQGNICGVWCTSLWPTINGHTTPIFVNNSMNDHFQYYRRLTPTYFLPRNSLHKKTKIVVYGKETYVGWGVWASGRWSMATQPPFVENSNERPFSIIPKGNTYSFFYHEMVSTRNLRMWSSTRKHMWGEVYEHLVDDYWPHKPLFVENSMDDHFQ